MKECSFLYYRRGEFYEPARMHEQTQRVVNEKIEWYHRRGSPVVSRK